MNREMLHRIKTAAEYQKKAVLALLPEETGRHLEVIEREVKMMLAEAAMGLAREWNKTDSAQETGNQEDKEKASKARKVEIE